MAKISYRYMIEELGFSPKQLQDIVQDSQNSLGKTLMMLDGALLEKAQFPEGDYEAFLPDKVKSELELESNFFSTNLSYNAVFQLTYQCNYFYFQEKTC